MKEPVQKFELKNGTLVKVFQDEFNENPRKDFDNLSEMIFFGKYAHLGDSHEFKADRYNNWHEMKKAIINKMDVALIVPIYAYSHSGLTISTAPFSCIFDSGQLGFSVITKEALRNNFSIKRCSKKYIEKARQIIECEVKILDQYVNGEIYGFEITDKDGNDIDSCWGFYGSDLKENGILENMNEEISKELLELI